MNKIKTVKIKNEDGTIDQESYSISADARNIDMTNGKNVQETIGTIDVDENGSIAEQLNNIDTNKINISDIKDNLTSTDINKPLSAKQGKILNDKINEQTRVDAETYATKAELTIETTARTDENNTLNTAITNEVTARQTAINGLQTQINSVAGGSPLVASSTAEMIDTTRVYVNTTDGHWYYYNGSSWSDGGTYQAIELPDNSITGNKYKKIKIISNNKFDKNTIKSGYISSSGVINDGATSGGGLNIYSDFIELTTPSNKVYVSTLHNIIFYDSNKGFISGTTSSASTRHTVPDNTKYIRISAVLSNLENIQVQFQSYPAPYDDYKFIIDQVVSESDLLFNEGQLIQKNIKGYENKKTNLFNKYDIIFGALSTTSGVLLDVSQQSTFLNPITSNFIEVESNSDYSRGGYGSYFAQCYYDENKEYISGAINQGISTPATCKYIRITCEKDVIDKIVIREQISGVSTTYSPFTFSIDGLRINEFNHETTFNNPLSHDINFEDLVKCRTINSNIVVKTDSITNKPYICLNEELTSQSTVRLSYFFKNVKKVLNCSINYKTAGNNDCAVVCKFFDKNTSEIFTALGNANIMPLNSSDWEIKNFRFLVPEEAVYIRFGVVSYAGSNLFVRDLNVNFSDISLINNTNAILKYCGHQGMSSLAPKNTIPSFEYAVAGGMNQCVINVNWTSDGEIVCLHDDTINATSDGTGNIHLMTYDQVLQYDFGSWFSNYYTGTKIPKLEDVLKLFTKAGVIPVIRWHDNANSTIRDKIFSLLEMNGLRNKAIIIGFDLTVLASLKTLYPDYQYGYSNIGVNEELTQQKCEEVISALGQNAIIDFEGVPSKQLVKLAHSNNLIIGAWFINTIANLYNAIDNGVDYIKTDMYALQNCKL